MQSVDLLLFPTWILPVRPANKVFENYAIAIKNGRIQDILPADQARKTYTTKNVKELPDQIVLPGLINAHTHSPMSFLRGIANDLPLMTWLKDYIWPTEKKWLGHEYVNDATELACAEMIKSGTTCFNEHYFFPESIAKITVKSGMRALIGATILEFPNNWSANATEAISKNIELINVYKTNDKVRITLAPHAPYTVDDSTFLKAHQIADQYDIPLHVHMHETHDEIVQSLERYKMRPLRRLHELGILSSKFIAVHMTQVNDEDFQIIKQTKINIIHCPESNLKLASGYCPVQKLLNQGINVALATDSVASNNDVDMIGEMRSAALLAKLIGNDPTHIPAFQALEMATINAAKAIGLEQEIGSLEHSKQADMIAIDLSHPATQPVYDPIGQIVYSTSRDQVSNVWVEGRELLSNGKLTTLDEKEIIAKTKNWGKKIKASLKPN